MTKKRQIPHKVWLGLGLALVLALLVWFALSGDNAELLKSLFTEELSNDELSRRLQSFGPRGYITVTVLAALQIVCTVFPAAPLQVFVQYLQPFTNVWDMRCVRSLIQTTFRITQHIRLMNVLFAKPV